MEVADPSAPASSGTTEVAKPSAQDASSAAGGHLAVEAVPATNVRCSRLEVLISLAQLVLCVMKPLGIFLVPTI